MPSLPKITCEFNAARVYLTPLLVTRLKVLASSLSLTSVTPLPLLLCLSLDDHRKWQLVLGNGTQEVLHESQQQPFHLNPRDAITYRVSPDHLVFPPCPLSSPLTSSRLAGMYSRKIFPVHSVASQANYPTFLST